MKRLLLPLVVLAALAGVVAALIFNRHPAGHTASGSRPIAVILDNIAPDARPQSGLMQADMVFEALAEGGITRFMAVYQAHDASPIGPVRSTRLYFNSWAAGLGVIFGHDGGNVDALQQLPKLNTVENIDADRTFGPFYRISARLAPHNEYTSTTALRQFARSHGADVSTVRVTYPSKADAPIDRRPPSFYIHVQFSYSDYNVDWTFDRASDTYLRSMGGVPHDDAATGRQLRANNVIVMFTDETAAFDPYTPNSIHLRTEGTGQAVVYQDGIAVPGTWSKPSVDAPLEWLDNSGKQIPLNRGQTWIEVVPKGNQVTAG